MGYRPDLDGLRALAVLAVLASHSRVPLTGGGWMGVDVFFVLSGFLITSLLVTERDRNGRVSLKHFYARRALRLYPALLFVLVAGLLFFRTLGDDGTLLGYGRTALFAGTYVEDFVFGYTGDPHGELGHTWSLAVEEQFYLLWPLVLVLLMRARRDALPWAVGGVVASWAIMAASMHQSADGIPDHAYYLPWCRFSALMLGCCVALLLHRLGSSARSFGAGTGWALLGAVVAAVVAASWLPRSPWLVVEMPVIGLLTAALLWHLAVVPGGVGSLLGWRPLAYVGRRSYGIYLYHVPVLVLLGTYLSLRRSVLAVLMVAVTLLIAFASYQWVERPFLRLKRKVSDVPPAARGVDASDPSGPASSVVSPTT